MPCRGYYGRRLRRRYSTSCKYNRTGRIPAAQPGQAAGEIGLFVKADKKWYMYFTQENDISTVNGGSLELM